MKNKGWDIAFAILWGVCLIINICSWITGGTPDWIHVICADILVIFYHLDHIFFY